jgi:hypothetical protein
MNFIAASFLYHCEEFMALEILCLLFNKLNLWDIFKEGKNKISKKKKINNNFVKKSFFL